jgi:hypothetical protein
MVQIQTPPSGVDPIIFLQELLEGFIIDDKGNHIPINTTFPKQINQLPRVAIFQRQKPMRFLGMPAIRRRWTPTFQLKVWALSVAQRYAIEQSIMGRMDNLSHPNQQLADNYVYMWFTVQEPQDDVRMFGQPIFKIDFTITLIFDTLTTQAGTLG